MPLEIFCENPRLLAVIRLLWYALCMKRAISVCLLIFALFCTSACSGKMGYGVVLWSIPEHGLFDGAVVPVYVRSNIGKVYIIGIPGSKQKIEVPLWRITDPESKGKALKTAQRLAEYRRQYAVAALDGLPIRTEPVNTAKQVYRLRLNEVIKVLYKGEGQAVMAGNTPLEGNWLRVLTEDGSSGWCFSYNLRLFDERNGVHAALQPAAEEKDELLEGVLKTEWVPEYYKSIIASGKIDTDRIKSEYGFDTGADSGFVSISVPELSAKEAYKGTAKTGENTYTFTGTSFAMTVLSPSSVTVQYTGQDGLPVSYTFISLEQSGVVQFVSLSQSVQGENGFADGSDERKDEPKKEDCVAALIENENRRRTEQYRRLSSFGPVFVSSNYGTLQLNENGSFMWRNFKPAITSEILPQSLNRESTLRGTVRIKYFVSNALESQFDGVLTFAIKGIEDEVNFLYKTEETGLRLEDMRGASVRNGVVQSRSGNPSVLFFAKQ